jgi:DDE superfamily endonuclease
MPDTFIVGSFVHLLQALVPCFTAPSFPTFVTLMGGWSLTTGRHTVTGVVRAANAVGWKHIRTFHRFFSEGRWLPDELGLILVRLVVERCLEAGNAIIVPVDDTLGRHTGKKIAGASMHRDPLLSTGRRPFFHWGHLWVVVGIAIPAFGKTWALPVLFRLYRGKKRCKAEKRKYRKCPELAAELIKLLADALPERRIIVVGDSAYTNGSIIKGRPKNITIVGRSRLDAALYAPAPARGPRQMGRPRVRGARLPSPEKQAAKASFKRIEVTVYGRTVMVRVLVIDALWYVAAHSELVRFVVVRDFPGHERDDVFVSTDTTMIAKSIIETFARRWSLEHTFHECKGKLGFEEPQNRTDRAVERTAPMSLWLHTLVVLWYLDAGQHLRAARQPALPWYKKTAPTFSDMLATLRRSSWAQRLSDPCANVQTLRKRMRPLVEALAA